MTALVIVAGHMVTGFGNSVYLVALLVAVARHAPDPINIGLIQASAYAPVFFLSILGGALADRMNRGGILAATDMLRAVFLVLAALALERYGTGILMPIILPLVLCNASMQALFSPALVSLSLDLQKSRAYPLDLLSLRTAAGHAASLSGQILGGMLVLRFGLAPLLAANGIGFFLSGLSELSLLGPARRSRQSGPGGRVARATGRGSTLKALGVELRDVQAKGAPIIAYLGLQAAAAFIMVSLPTFLRTRMLLGEEYLGYAMAALLTGSIAAALFMGGIGSRLGQRRQMILSRVAVGLAAAAAFTLSLLGPGFTGLFFGALVLSGIAAGYLHILTLQLVYRLGAPGTAAQRQGAIEALATGILPLAYLSGGAFAMVMGGRIEWMFRLVGLLLVVLSLTRASGGTRLK